MAYIGIDVGTSGCKAAVVEKDGSIVSMSRKRYHMIHPNHGWTELSPMIVWEAVKSAVKEIACYSKDVESMAISSIGETMIFLDENDDPLMNGILYLDCRCNEMMDTVLNDFGQDRLFLITGTPLSPMFSLFRYIWIRENMPEVIEHAKKVFLFSDYLSYMFCGERGLDHSTASRTAFFDVHRLEWSEEIMDFFNIKKELFSPIKATGTWLGNIRSELAEELQLPAGIKLYVGCHDQCGVTLGCGALTEGDIIGSEGSTEGFNLLMGSNIELLTKKKMPFEPFVTPGQYFATVGQLAHGTSIRWFVEKVGHEMGNGHLGESAYDKADALCAEDSDDVIFLPYLSEVSFSSSKADMLGGFIGINTNTDTHKMYRAVLEGVCFESRSAMQQYDDLGIPLNSLKCTGGCTTSDTLMQIKSDILEKDISVLHEIESGIIGLSMICAVAAGDCASYQEAAGRFVRIKKTFHPQKDYSQKYTDFLRLGECIRKYCRKQ
ncbi:MAG: FGGY-family carbohydrate kinase [Christensenellales bacterium]|jgi:xylulokinase